MKVSRALCAKRFKKVNTNFASAKINASNWPLLAANWVPEQTRLAKELVTGVFDQHFGRLKANYTAMKTLEHYLEEIKKQRIKQIPDRTTAEILMRCFYKTEDKERQSHLPHHIRLGDGWAIDGADCKDYRFDSFTPYVFKEKVNLGQALKVRGIMYDSKHVVVGRLAHEADVLFMCGVIMCCEKRSLQEVRIFAQAGQHLLKALKDGRTKFLHPCTIDKVLDALVVLHTNRFEKRDRAGADVDNLNVSDTDTFMDNDPMNVVHDAFGLIINWIKYNDEVVQKKKGPDTAASNHIRTITPHFLDKMAPCMDSTTLRQNKVKLSFLQ